MEYIRSKRMIFATIGAFVVILPALGFPRMVKDFLFVVSGVVILWMAFKEPTNQEIPEKKEEGIEIKK